MKKHLLLALTSLLLLGNVKDARSQTGTTLNFDGADDYVSISNYTGIPTGNSNYTLEAWINPGFTAARYGIIGLGNYGSSNTVNALRTGDAGEGSGIVNYWWSGGDMTVTQAEIGFSIYDGNWHHIAVTYDGTNKSCYVDGNLKKTMAVSAPNVAATNFTIGKTCCTEYFFGGMDEVRIWNIARTQAEIQNYMNCPVKDNPASLIANYSFNDGLANGTNTTNTTLHDVTGNGHNGTLTNFALSGAGSNFGTDIRADYLSQQSSIGSTGVADRLGNAVAGDFNGDGLNDIIATSDNGDARLYLNGGKGNFPNSFTTLIPATGGNFDVADIDNDGDMDFTHADYTSTVKVYINNGSAVFTPISVILNGTGVASITKIADINNDGKLDLIIGNNNSGATDNTEVWWNTGTTGSAAFTFKAGLANIQGSKNSIAVGDIDGDGDKDIITGSSSWSAELFLNNSNNGTFTQGTAPAGYAGGVRLLDWDQDGKLDYLNYDAYNNYGLRFRKGDGAGNFASTAVILLQSASSNHCYLADLNADGFLDAVLDHWGGDGLVYTNNGCALTLQNGCNYTLGHADNGVVVADFNGDAKPDAFCEARDFASTFYMNYLTPVVTPALSNIITTTPNSICGSGTVVLGATASNSGTVNWYSVSSGGSSLATGTSYTTSSISSTTTYYVDATNSNGCVSSRTAVVATVGICGAALNFDGIDDYVSVPDNSSLNFGTGDFTVEASFQSTFSQQNYAGLVVKANCDGNPYVGWQLVIVNNKIALEIIDGTNGFGVGNGLQGTTSLNDGNWHHLAMVVNRSTSTIQLLVDGNIEANVTNPLFATLNISNSAMPVYIGRERCNVAFIHGNMDEVRLWNRALCQGEIQNNMNCEIATTGTGLVANYHFNQGVSNATNSGVTTLTDASGSGFNGTLTNFALTGSSSNWTSPGAVTAGSSCAAFTGPSITGTTPASRCGNGTVTLGASTGAGTLNWYAGSTGGSSLGTGTSFTTPSLTVTTTYYVDATNTGCVSPRTAVVATVNPLPTVTITGATSICNGQSAFLTGHGANTYLWDGGQTTATRAVSPTSNTTYTVTGTTTSTGCSNSATHLITVNSLPNVTISGTATICNGQSTVLTGNGANTYAWDGGQTTATNTVSPTSNTTYTVIGTTTSTGCSNSATQLVTVNSLPNVTISGTTTICNGQSTVLTGNGANTFTWTSGPSAASNTVSPTSNTTYTVTGTTTSTGCSNTATQLVTVNALPVITAQSGNVKACGDVSASFSVTSPGTNTYQWNYVNTVSPFDAAVINGTYTEINYTTANMTITQLITGLYDGYAVYCTVTNSNNCSFNSAPDTITVKALPNVTISGTATICNGQSTILTGNGANTYVWTSGPSTTSNTVSPTSNTTYTVTGTTTSTGCSNSATQLVTVNSLPVVTTAGTSTNPSGCGATDGSVSGFVVSGSPAIQYSWNGGASQSTPDLTNIGAGAYSLVITDGNGCTQNGGTFSLSDPGAPPAPTFTISSAPICEGGSVTLTINSPNGSATYSWTGPSGAIGTGTVVTINNATIANDNGSYTAQISLSGCTSSSASQNIIVNALPTVNITGISAICSGTGTTLTGSGATSYTWSANAGSVNTSSVSVSPSATDTYTLTGEDNGCSASNTITVNVTITPTLSISGSMAVCLGSSTTLTASGATTYTWSSNAGSATTSTVSVSPTSNDTYTVSGNNGNCSDVTTVSVAVNSLPNVTFDVNPNQLCSTDPAVTLSATPSNGTFTGTGVSSNQFDPSVAGVGSYTLTYNYTDGNNCSNTDTAQVSVILCTTSINQLTSSSVNIYPNPASTVINIVSSGLGANSVLEIYNSLGQKVSSVILTSASTQVSVTDLNNGIYEARIISDNTIVYKARIVKQF